MLKKDDFLKTGNHHAKAKNHRAALVGTVMAACLLAVSIFPGCSLFGGKFQEPAIAVSGESAPEANATSEPAGQPSETVQQPSEPAEQPSETVQQASRPAEQISKPAGQFSEAVQQISKPAGQLSEAAQQVSEPTGQPSEAGRTSAESEGQISEPADSNPAGTEEQTAPTEKSTGWTDDRIVISEDNLVCDVSAYGRDKERYTTLQEKDFSGQPWMDILLTDSDDILGVDTELMERYLGAYAEKQGIRANTCLMVYPQVTVANMKRDWFARIELVFMFMDEEFSEAVLIIEIDENSGDIYMDVVPFVAAE